MNFQAMTCIAATLSNGDRPLGEGSTAKQRSGGARPKHLAFSLCSDQGLDAKCFAQTKNRLEQGIETLSQPIFYC